jgi:hypothetical protein
LGSFRTRESARQAAAQYRQKGILAHWQPLSDGRWFRVIAGKFENMLQAKRYQREHGLAQSMIITAPFTVRVLSKQPDMAMADICESLAQLGHDCLMESGQAGDTEIYTGLYLSVDDASIVGERINATSRLLAQVVRR